VAVPTSAPAPIQITPAPYESFKPALPVKVQSTPPVKQVPVVESKGGYIPRNNGYTPGYLSKSYESPTVTSSRPVYPSASSAAGASVQPFFENSIISPPASKPSQPIEVAVTQDLDAGAITLGSSSQAVLLFRNDGNRPISMQDISLYPSSNVSANIGENECSQTPLPPNAVCAISMSVKGLQPGNFRIQMILRHDGRAKLITAVVKGGVERSADNTYDVINDLETIPSEIKFGTLNESRPLTRSVVLRNVTSKPVKIEDIFIESNEQAGYSLRSDCEGWPNRGG